MSRIFNSTLIKVPILIITHRLEYVKVIPFGNQKKMFDKNTKQSTMAAIKTNVSRYMYALFVTTRKLV